MPETPSFVVALRLAAALLAAQTLAACGPSGDDGTYLITFAVSDFPDDVDGLATLSFDVEYRGGEFLGNGQDVDCGLLETDNDETATFTDDDDDTLRVEITATDFPLETATEIVECRFSASEQPGSDDFAISVEAATDQDENPVAPGDVDLVISSIDLESDE